MMPGAMAPRFAALDICLGPRDPLAVGSEIRAKMPGQRPGAL